MMKFDFSKIKTKGAVMVLVISLALVISLSVLLIFFLNKNKVVEAQAVYEYQKDAVVVGWQTPRCSCDIDDQIFDCPATFPATAADPNICYDRLVITVPLFGVISLNYIYNKIEVGGGPGGQDNFIRVCVDGPLINPNACGNPPPSQCPSPDLSDPTQPIFKWDTFGNAQTNFQLQVDDDPAFGSPAINISGGTEQSYQAPPGTLPLARTYWYRINVSDNGTRWTGWTGCNSFYLRGLNPSANTLSVSMPGNCLLLPPVIFSWTFVPWEPTDFQTAYQVQIDNNSNFSLPEVDSCVPAPGTCNPYNGSNSYATYLSKLSYGETYYWRLQVWDRDGMSSNWVYPPSPPGSLTPAPGTPFPTPSHGYPSPNFSVSPNKPTVNELVYFTDNSKCYLVPGNMEDNCRNNASNRYQWDFQNDGIIDCDSNTKPICRGDATTTYAVAGQYSAKLFITDDIGTCSMVQSIGIGLSLPEWKEIPPF